MKSKIQFIILSIWTAIVMFAMPFCIGLIYMDITGHSKGYDYNLGSEKNIWMMMGTIELIICGVLVILLFALGIWFMGGWHEFIRCFGLS